MYGRRVSALKIRTALNGLPYVSEGYILCVPDCQRINRVAALVRLQEDHECCQDIHAFNLVTLRHSLSHLLTEYELPTLLRILRKTDETPKGVSGKLMYAKAIDRYFPLSPGQDVSYLPKDVHIWNLD